MIKLIRDEVAVQPLFEPDMYGMIYIPDQAKSRCNQGIVKYLGPKCQYLKMGDHVIFSGYTGTTFEVEDELLIIFKEKFAVCLLETPPTLIPGLYFKGTDGQYFHATYENAIKLIARGLQEQPWHNKLVLKMNVAHPTVKDYDDEEEE